MVRPLIAGNWKMHKTIGEAVRFAEALRSSLADPLDREVLIAPPYTALHAVAGVLQGSAIGLAGQNLHDQEAGAYTGEVSGRMLLEAGCRYVIVGHSERRSLFCEDDALICGKLKAAWKSGLIPIFCIGETLRQRETDQTFGVLERQIKEGLHNCSADDISRAVFAYEPVWAIGTGRTATPGQAQEVHAFIRGLLGTLWGIEAARGLRILYGGSVNADTIGGLMAQSDIDGALVGGASLEAASFVRIVNY